MRITVFKEHKRDEISTDALAKRLKAEEDVVWVDMRGPSEQEIAVLRNTFKFHPLAIEDTHNQKQRPKAEEFSDHLFIILNPVAPEHAEDVFHELDVFVGHNFVVTVHSDDDALLDRVRARLEPKRTSFPVSATYLLYVLFDEAVDGYAPLLERIEDELEELGNRLFANPRKEVLNRLFELQQTLNQMSRVLGPQQDIVNVLLHHHLVFIDQDSQYYLRDITDHLLRTNDAIRIQRDTVNSLLNLYISAVSYHLNRDVNRLTRLAIVVGGLTVISGFYGMNFADTWPPFAAWWGVPLVIAMMVGAVVTILFFLRDST